MEINGAHILVTGGAGMIGSTTIEQLLRDCNPARIVIFDNLVRGVRSNIERSLRDPRVELVLGDVRDASAVSAAMQGMDAVMHMAALRIPACAADPREAMDVMCTGSFNVVEAARAAGVQKVVAASSASVYGLADSFPTSEQHHPYNDQTLYGATKTMLEGLLRSYHAMHGLPYVALRYFNVYGPRMDTHGKYTEVFVRWMERIADGQPPLILGNGRQTMDFIYIDDVARANVLALQSSLSHDVFNIASGRETSLRELAAAMVEAMDADMEPVYGPERSVNPVARRLADVSKAQRQLGFKSQVSLDQGLRRLIDWWHTGKAATQATTQAATAEVNA
jgi:UDP-glucose 4-epimerase